MTSSESNWHGIDDQAKCFGKYSIKVLVQVEGLVRRKRKKES